MLSNVLLHHWRWPVFAIIASFAMLGGAHAFERIGMMAPCPLCLRQREVYWAAIAMAVTGLALWRMRPSDQFITALNVLMGMVFITGAVVAFYHAGVELKFWEGPAGCSATPSSNSVVETDLLSALGKPMATGNCGEVPWSLLGISMAGWNGLISAGLAIMSFAAARATVIYRRTL